MIPDASCKGIYKLRNPIQVTAGNFNHSISLIYLNWITFVRENLCATIILFKFCKRIYYSACYLYLGWKACPLQVVVRGLGDFQVSKVDTMHYNKESLKFQAKTQSDHQMLVPNFSPLGSSGAEILRGGRLHLPPPIHTENLIHVKITWSQKPRLFPSSFLLEGFFAQWCVSGVVLKMLCQFNS